MEEYLETWEDTAGLIENLDLVISSCTSVAHLAAALNKMTWVIVPTLSYYIWAKEGNKDNYGELTDYYDCVRLHRAGKNHNWEKAFKSIDYSLKNFKKR